jgi:hypothetical protein
MQPPNAPKPIRKGTASQGEGIRIIRGNIGMKQQAKVITIRRDPCAAMSFPAKTMAETAPSPIITISTPISPEAIPCRSIILGICGAQAPMLNPLIRNRLATAQRPIVADCMKSPPVVVVCIGPGLASEGTDDALVFHVL